MWICIIKWIFNKSSKRLASNRVVHWAESSNFICCADLINFLLMDILCNTKRTYLCQNKYETWLCCAQWVTYCDIFLPDLLVKKYIDCFNVFFRFLQASQMLTQMYFWKALINMFLITWYPAGNVSVSIAIPKISQSKLDSNHNKIRPYLLVFLFPC